MQTDQAQVAETQQVQEEPKKIQWNQIQDDGEEHRNQYKQKQKPKMQSRGEIEKLITDCEDEEILLNIVKCHFDATVEDVVNTFKNFEFLKVENYNPGSFSLLFKNKEQAKEFLFTTKDTRIKDRGFWIKFPMRFQKSSQKLGQNPNHEQPLRQTGSKFQDAPPRNTENFNRKASDGEGGRGEQRQRQEQHRQYPHQKPHHQKQYQKEKDEEGGWQVVVPRYMRKLKEQSQVNRRPRNQ